MFNIDKYRCFIEGIFFEKGYEIKRSGLGYDIKISW